MSVWILYGEKNRNLNFNQTAKKPWGKQHLLFELATEGQKQQVGFHHNLLLIASSPHGPNEQLVKLPEFVCRIFRHVFPSLLFALI